MALRLQYDMGDEAVEDGKKLKEFLKKSPKEAIKKLINKLELANDSELTELANYIKSLFR